MEAIVGRKVVEKIVVRLSASKIMTIYIQKEHHGIELT